MFSRGANQRTMAWYFIYQPSFIILIKINNMGNFFYSSLDSSSIEELDDLNINDLTELHEETFVPYHEPYLLFNKGKILRI